MHAHSARFAVAHQQTGPPAGARPALTHADSPSWGTLSAPDAQGQGRQDFPWRLVGTAVPVAGPSAWTCVKGGDRPRRSPPGAPGLSPESLLWLRGVWVERRPCAPEPVGRPLGGRGPSCPGHPSEAQLSRVPARRGVRAGASASGRPFGRWGSLLPPRLPHCEAPGRGVRGFPPPCGWTETSMKHRERSWTPSGPSSMIAGLGGQWGPAGRPRDTGLLGHRCGPEPPPDGQVCGPSRTRGRDPLSLPSSLPPSPARTEAKPGGRPALPPDCCLLKKAQPCDLPQPIINLILPVSAE